MKRNSLLFVAILLMLTGASSVWAADEIRHKVDKGECLSVIGQQYYVDYREIKRLNNLKSDLIRINQILIIQTSSKAEAAIVKAKVAQPNKSVSVAKTDMAVAKIAPLHKKTLRSVVTRWLEKHILPGLRTYLQENAGRDKYTGTPVFAAYLLGVVSKDEMKDTEVVLLLTPQGQKPLSDPLNQLVKKGDRIKMTSGKNKVGDYIAGFQFFVEKAEVYVKGEFRGYIYRSPWCGNWISKEEKIGPPPVHQDGIKTIHLITETPEEESIFVSKKVEKSIFQEHELNLGNGIWRNNSGYAKGYWWYAEYKAHLRNLANSLAGGTVTPEIGVFAKGDLGKVNNGYRWNNAGIGPEAGAAWTSLTEAGYPQQVQVVFRLLWEHLHGENSSSGYEKTENHILIGEYAEYLRRFAPDLMSILYAEGWLDVSKSFSSTWSGDKASSRTGLAIGYKLHKDWNETWASRFGVQLGWTEQDNQFIANANIEMRYNNWLIFGPSFDYTLASAIEGAAGSSSTGLFLRGEFHWLVKGLYSKNMSDGVESSDIQILNY